MMDFDEIAKKANEYEDKIGLNIDDVLNKLTQEMGEFNDAVQKFRGRYSRRKYETTKEVEGELGDLIFNIVSVCKRLGINPNRLSEFSESTLNKFGGRVDMYIHSMNVKKIKICICGSISFYDEMVEMKSKLEGFGHEVDIPPKEIKDSSGNLIPVKDYYQIRQTAGDNDVWVWERKKEAMQKHFEKIDWSDAILVLNYGKKGIRNYIGSNTLMEMGLAFHLKKKIFLLNDVPDISAKEEILGMQPIIINGDLFQVK